MLRGPAALIFSEGAGRRPSIPVPPKVRGVKRRNALVRNAAPRGPPRDRAGLRIAGDCRRMTLAGAPFGASPRRSSSGVGPRFRRATARSSASSWQAARSGQPGGAPTPPGCKVTSLARGRRIPLRLRLSSGKTPLAERDCATIDPRNILSRIIFLAAAIASVILRHPPKPWRGRAAKDGNTHRRLLPSFEARRYRGSHLRMTAEWIRPCGLCCPALPFSCWPSFPPPRSFFPLPRAWPAAGRRPRS